MYIIQVKICKTHNYTSHIIATLSEPKISQLIQYIYIYTYNLPQKKTSLSKLTISAPVHWHSVVAAILLFEVEPFRWSLGAAGKPSARWFFFAFFFGLDFFWGGIFFWLDGFWMIWVFFWFGLSFGCYFCSMDLLGCFLDVWMWCLVKRGGKKTGQASWTVLPL